MEAPASSTLLLVARRSPATASGSVEEVFSIPLEDLAQAMSNLLRILSVEVESSVLVRVADTSVKTRMDGCFFVTLVAWSGG